MEGTHHLSIHSHPKDVGSAFRFIHRLSTGCPQGYPQAEARRLGGRNELSTGCEGDYYNNQNT